MSRSTLTLALVVLLTTAFSTPTAALKILGLFPHPAISHFRFFEPVLRELAAAGHDVTVVGLFPLKDAPENYHDIIIPGEVLTNAFDLQEDWFVSRRRYGHYYEMPLVLEWGTATCRNYYNSSGLQRIIRERQHFDVIIMEHFNTDCLMGIAWHLRAPVISMSSCALMPWHYDRVGNPHIPSYIPSLFQSGSEEMTFSQRFFNWVDIHVWKLFYKHFVNTYTDRLLQEQFGDQIPPIEELVKTTSMIFVNQHYSLSGSRPLSPSVVELGGIHIKESQALTPEIQKYLDEAIDGVVFVSWGSMVRAASMPDDKRESLVQAFGSLKQRVLWKWENETIPNKPRNVRIAKWLQQRDILCHPNVRVFVSHGGLMGSSEAAHCGVPSVLTPMFGDQSMNAAAFVNRGMGVVVNYEDITKETMLNALKVALKPESLANAKSVAYAFNNRLRPARETAVWWVEHVAASHGSPLSKSYSVHMSAWTYYSLDVIGTLLAGLLLIVASWWWTIRWCLCSAQAKSMSRSKKQKSN